MNAVEIEEAISELARQPFKPDEFPYSFLKAFGNKAATLKRLRSGTTNKSDLGGVLQTKNIHIAVTPKGKVTATLAALKVSPATEKAKAKYVLATDGVDFEAEELTNGETVACSYEDFPDHFGFFLQLAGISTVRQIRDNAFDIKATSRLNKLYVELLKDNPDWGTADRRADMNHFVARLIFCFFAEDTDIFMGSDLFTKTVEQMSARDSSNTHEVIEQLFLAMNTSRESRGNSELPRWAAVFPYVNGGLFSGKIDVPRFSKIARSYLLHVGSLDWTKVNPDIFGSMIQAVADDDERGELGMHYTSVPNILKVLNPLFLENLREQLGTAGANARKLLNLRKRMSRIRVFDPACGSGNFLVVAYKQMREIENAVNERRGEPGRESDIPLTNFRGIEIRDFSAEIARLALIIAEFQCDVLYRGQKEALAVFLPLATTNWVTCGNALHIDWLSVCPPSGIGVKVLTDDLFDTPLKQAEIDFENEGGETYICGNPPYLGSTWQSKEQKNELKCIFEGRTRSWKSLDYVAGWFMKAADYGLHTHTVSAFVSTNSICQGQQVPILWPLVFETGNEIAFAHTSFKWKNLASHNAGVTVVIVGINSKVGPIRRLYSAADEGETLSKEVDNINAYLVGGPNIIVQPQSKPAGDRATMEWGNKPTDGGHLILSTEEKDALLAAYPDAAKFVFRYVGSQELTKGGIRWCLWISDDLRSEAESFPPIKRRVQQVAESRAKSSSKDTRPAAAYPHRFRQIQNIADSYQILVSGVSSENREFLPVDVRSSGTIGSNKVFALYDAPLWNMALIASRMHIVWVGAVCVRMRTDFSYSNTLGWNAFPMPRMTKKNREDLTAAAERILLVREEHFPKTIAELYQAKDMPGNLRAAHDHNDDLLERMYIGRRFKNDSERLEKLFNLYAKSEQ